jgi:succinate dehydrogenase/fumarate reductase-like Fe-S protein
MKKLFATIMLALYIARHFILRAFYLITRRHARHVGYASFVDNYGADGIQELTAEEMVDFGRLSRCIRCGLCDTLCANTLTLARANFSPVSLLASTHSRSLADAHLTDGLVAQYTSCSGCERCFNACPTQVPIARIVARLQRLSLERHHHMQQISISS